MLFACDLEARRPEANLARAYHIAVSQSLNQKIMKACNGLRSFV